MKQYLQALRHILENGNDRIDRTGVGTRGIFIYQMQFDLAEGFPLLTTKDVWARGIIHELVWFLHGDTNIRYLALNGVKIWHDWALKRFLKAHEQEIPKSDTEQWKGLLGTFHERIIKDEKFAKKWGELGPVYSRQWRAWPTGQTEQNTHDHIAGVATIDQVGNLVRNLKSDPFSRRHIVSAWNPVEVPDMALPPCHTLWQCYVQENKVKGEMFDKTLSLHLYARSIDTFLGLPFNIASYALLLSMLAKVTDMEPGVLGISFGDLHIYKNHMEQVKEQLSREPRKLPTLIIPKRERLEDYVYEDIKIEGYDHYPAIKAPIAV
jgi:thymidylate synthase